MVGIIILKIIIIVVVIIRNYKGRRGWRKEIRGYKYKFGGILGWLNLILSIFELSLER